MNENLPPPFTGTSATPSFPKVAGPPLSLSRLLLGLLLVVVSFDVCFWNLNAMGFSVAVFVLVLVGVILANRETGKVNKWSSILLALLGGATLATTIETGTTNTLVLILLIIALAGQTFFCEIESLWGRWLSQGVALVFAPGRIFWLAGVLLADVCSSCPR